MKEAEETKHLESTSIAESGSFIKKLIWGQKFHSIGSVTLHGHDHTRQSCMSLGFVI